ncbi:MAG: ComF family protein [Candidatus Poribacteria bacterium]|nr:ComF family protein [Candidatus Poribacteria bacterium]MYK16832.1 ComF family protein [Candidatus Poribacteria bacterium]
MALKSIGLQIPNLLRDLCETGIVFLYPAKCRVCEAFLEVTSIPYICADCWHDVQFLEPPWCDICGTPDVRGLCDECATAPPRYGKLRSIAFYQTTLQDAIHLFKFEKKQVFAEHLIHLINAHIPIDCCIADYDFILPVPIHKKRLRERGFNQATLLAKGIAQTEGVPILTDTLVRHRHTVAQSSLGMEARQHNITGAFEVPNPEVIRDKRILIVDDVFTTGATIREAVNELWKADPAEVDVLTLARTLNA